MQAVGVIGWQGVDTKPAKTWEYYLTRDKRGSVIRALFNPGMVSSSDWTVPKVCRDSKNKHIYYLDYIPVFPALWANLEAEQGEEVKARRSRKANSYFNKVKENK